MQPGARLPAAVLAGAILAAASCAPGGATDVTEAPLPPARPTAPTPPLTLPSPEDFADWRAAFRARALAQGIAPETFDRAFAGVAPNETVLERDAYQPEFVRPIWEYLDRAVSDERVAAGRDMALLHGTTLRRIEAEYRVDGPIVLAIWGLESAYGSHFGDIPVIESLATLAFEGRRRGFAEEQLIAALKILQSGDVAPERMRGSWAGAMGHTQFIPTSFLAYAVDFTGDGRRDVWAADPADALASTANYLARFGWQRGAPVALEVVLPEGFDYLLATGAERRSGTGWAALGVLRADGGALPGDEAALIVPAGARGPAFLAYANFRVIRRYNNATSYALAATLLAGEIAGTGHGVIAAWPRDDRPLTRDETVELQERLTALGYDTQGADGIIGPMSRAAVRAFQRAQRQVPDGYVSAALLEAVRAAGG